MDEMEERIVILRRKLAYEVTDAAKRKEYVAELGTIHGYLQAFRRKLLKDPTGSFPKLEREDDDGKDG